MHHTGFRSIHGLFPALNWYRNCYNPVVSKSVPCLAKIMKSFGSQPTEVQLNNQQSLTPRASACQPSTAMSHLRHLTSQVNFLWNTQRIVTLLPRCLSRNLGLIWSQLLFTIKGILTSRARLVSAKVFRNKQTKKQLKWKKETNRGSYYQKTILSLSFLLIPLCLSWSLLK